MSLGAPFPSAVADVNGDGIPDEAVLGGGSVEIYLGTGRDLRDTVLPGTGPAPGTIFAADLHGQPRSEHLPDLVAPDETGGVIVLLNETK